MGVTLLTAGGDWACGCGTRTDWPSDVRPTAPRLLDQQLLISIASLMSDNQFLAAVANALVYNIGDPQSRVVRELLTSSTHAPRANKTHLNLQQGDNIHHCVQWKIHRCIYPYV